MTTPIPHGTNIGMRNLRRIARAALVTGALVGMHTALAPVPAAAQLRMRSEPAMLSQTVDGTTLKIEYHRPVARGRDSLFGGLVKWDQPWTPGANWATTFEVDRAVHLNGHAVPKGKYSVWMVPREQGEWTVFLSSKERLFHTQKPKDESNDVVRFAVTPQKGEYLEALTWYIPAIAGDALTLRMHWGETVVALRVSVEPDKPSVLEPAQHAKYVGSYTIDGAGNSGATVRVSSAAGKLRAELGAAVAGLSYEVALVPAGEDRFWLATQRNEQYLDTDPSTVLVFRMQADQAVGFEIRRGPEVIVRAGRAQ